MKQKVGFILFMSVFLLSVCAFHYEGTQSRVTATQGQTSNPSENQQLESIVSEKENSKKVKQDVNQQSKVKKDGNESKATVEDSSQIEKNQSVPANKESSSDTEKLAAEEEDTKDRIKIGETEFVNIMDVEKFADLADLAKKHQAILYAVPNSDVFTIIKDGKSIFNLSTGVAITPKEHSNILLEFFSLEDYQQKGIIENIHLVMETGAKVTVEFEAYVGYAIYMENGSVVVSW